MNCMASLCAGDTREESLPKMELQAPLVQRVRDRQAAASYLEAAAMTDNAVKRRFLRGRAAELILPVGHRGQRLAC